jgi:amino acid transporter
MMAAIAPLLAAAIVIRGRYARGMSRHQTFFLVAALALSGVSIAGAVLAGVETSALIIGVSNASSFVPLPSKLAGPWQTFEIVTPLAIAVIVALAVMIYLRARESARLARVTRWICVLGPLLALLIFAVYAGQAAYTFDPPSS